MAAKSSLLHITESARTFCSFRRGLRAGIVVFNKPSASSTAPKSLDVPGLSSQVLKVPSEPVGPGASKTGEYKNPEYYCYDKTSYFEAEIEMLKYRCPQPSSKGQPQK